MKRFFLRLIKTLGYTAVSMYIVVTLYNQQVKLSDYRSIEEQYEKSIQDEKLKNEQLLKAKSEVSSAKYIEEVAREKLGLVMPYEIVFVDASL